jgi:hypothetical protein
LTFNKRVAPTISPQSLVERRAHSALPIIESLLEQLAQIL